VGIDLCLVRESTEDEYSVLENQFCPGVVEFLKIMTKFRSYRFAEYEFDFALKNSREFVTAVHKAKFLELGYGLVKTTLVSWIMLLYSSFPIHDNALFWPYGSILSNFGAALIDVLGLVPGASFGR
ncbi:hypothetical protein L150_05136, partial [Candida albicans Ca529L]